MSEKITDTISRLEMERRIKLREERERKKKEAQRRYYIVGELFCKYFPVVNNLPPGKKAQNAETFFPLEEFLESISSNPESQELLSNLIDEHKGIKLLHSSNRCVSGHTERKEANPNGEFPHGSREFSTREKAVISQMLKLHQRSKGKG